MKNYSIWLEGIAKDKYPTLDKDIETDILIIGGGITGISTAYHLRKSKLKICVVDRGKVGLGISSKTTGKLTYLQDLIYTKLSKQHSCNSLKEYLNSQKDAIKLVESIIKKHGIDCDYTKQKSYLFASSVEEINKVKHEQELLQYLKVKVQEEKIPLNLDSNYSISVSDTAYFHPIKYINSLAKICSQDGIEIYENSKITNIEKDKDIYVCTSGKNTITCKKVILACHYPFFVFPFVFPLKGHLERSYISASKVLENKTISGINVSKNTKSFRYHNDKLNNYLIYLSGSHSLAFKYNAKENFSKLVDEVYGLKIKPEFIWSNIDIITNDYLPYIGLIEDNLYIGTGYNTWGMTNGSIAGKILSDLVLGKENKYVKLFDPKRGSSSVSSIIEDVFSSAKPFLSNKIIKNKTFYSDKVIFAKKDGKNIAIYIDNDGKKHIVYNKCPHLKCSLIFNEVEKTWDCPCHASRFDLDGNVIEGPSCYNISYNKEI
ncbi:MAG: FAD-dependent oxidoreductase [Firmicutes bacterium]|nr:FAD-dependent oxidoreductase [Bacillota bacterium]